MSDDPTPRTEPTGSLVPPVVPPPGAEASGTPEPEPEPATGGGLRAKVPGPVATVVDRVMDAADEVAEELRRAIDRIR